ncbi:CHAP domain-containing protein [Nonomuraea basaltis]|uniref:CHAP domain-containing protein n=1 Tax=Nonomuraea basaltis TaxID=2495887 RepID=UPI00110C500D|nr:CHAP domain-containing protein [Nonomuraea basaltis]TMR97521.1 CHAP domain-containing protein [Nonomuraea basaltis]
MPKRPEDVLLDIVRGELGQGERRDGWTRYGAWWAERHDKPDWWAKQPWCAMFLAWAADKAKLLPDVGDFAYTPTYADWFKDRGRWGQAPRRGAIVFFDWAGSKNMIGAIDHVGIVEAVHRDGTITTIEGNTSNRVMRHRRSHACISGYGYPAYSGVKPAPAPELTWMEEIVKQLPTLRHGAGKTADDPLRWHVKTLFYLLHARDYGLNGGVDDTQFGDPLYDALKEFQKAAKLPTDGVCGPKTWAALLRVV